MYRIIHKWWNIYKSTLCTGLSTKDEIYINLQYVQDYPQIMKYIYKSTVCTGLSTKEEIYINLQINKKFVARTCCQRHKCANDSNE